LMKLGLALWLIIRNSCCFLFSRPYWMKN